MQEFSTSPPILDIATAVSRMAGDRDFYWEIFPAFMQQVEEEIARLKIALSVKNADHCRTITHTIKSSAASVGAEQLRVLAAELELASARRDLTLVEQNLAAIEDSYTAVLQAAKTVSSLG